MLGFSYLGALLFSLCGMLVLDKRHTIALFADARRTVMTVVVSVLVFIVWDVLGIGLGIFFSGKSPFMSGLYLAPEFPIEELLFLTFLCYFTLILYRLGERRWLRT